MAARPEPKPSPAIARRNAAIVAAYRDGVSRAALARRYRVTEKTVYGVLYRAGLRKRGRAQPDVGKPQYSAAEGEYLAACARFLQEKTRRFMNATDYLSVLLELGYHR